MVNKLMQNDPYTRKFYKGCLPRDYLPSKLEKRSLYVINLSPSTSKGSHWVLISTMHNEYSAYICSLGTPPVHQHVLDSLYSVSDKVVWSDFTNQGLSTLCGFHCCYVSHLLSRGQTLITIMEEFYCNQQYLNDRCIVEILSTAHDIKEVIPIIDRSFV